jgi:hypothetical protein
MAKRKPTQPRRGDTMWWIGVWATIWWAVSGLYFVWWFWLAKADYAQFSDGWWSALNSSYASSPLLGQALAIILLIWIAGAAIWFRELKRLKISYASALRELFFTIR